MPWQITSLSSFRHFPQKRGPDTLSLPFPEPESFFTNFSIHRQKLLPERFARPCIRSTVGQPACINVIRCLRGLHIQRFLFGCTSPEDVPESIPCRPSPLRHGAGNRSNPPSESTVQSLPDRIFPALIIHTVNQRSCCKFYRKGKLSRISDTIFPMVFPVVSSSSTNIILSILPIISSKSSCTSFCWTGMVVDFSKIQKIHPAYLFPGCLHISSL